MFIRMVQRFATDSTMTWKIETSTDKTHWAMALTGQANRAL